MPAVIVTADTRRTTRDAAMHLGVSAYLEKPVRGRVLAAAVREAISKRNARL
jgi:DNA-binding NarL/FixJ family response regulator